MIRLRRELSTFHTIGKVRAAVAALKPGDEVRMPCAPDKWERVTKVKDLSRGDFVCFSIDVEGGRGHGGEIPLGIRRG